MRYLVELFLKYRFWLMFIIFEVVSLISLVKFNKYQGSVYFTTANDIAGGWYSITSSVTSFFDMKSENERLEHENEMLRKRLNDLRSGLKEDENTMEILSDKNRDLRNYDIVDAHVVNATLHRAQNVFTLDRGTSDGISEQNGVVCSSGVVGIVYKCSSHYSVVVPLINEKSMVSCRLDTTNYFGTLQWQLGDPSISYLNGIARHADVKTGMLVETNGFSDIFPEHIPIGTVSKIDDSDDGLSYSLTVKLFTDFSRLRNVSVITNYTRKERKSLEMKVDSLLSDK